MVPHLQGPENAAKHQPQYHPVRRKDHQNEGAEECTLGRPRRFSQYGLERSQQPLDDEATGDAATDDVATGNVGTGDVATGDVATGDTATLNATCDEMQKGGSTEVVPNRCGMEDNAYWCSLYPRGVHGDKERMACYIHVCTVK